MAFEVTATRKRPQTFEQLAGQHFVAATLVSSLEQGRIAHAYLFSGPRGCGKTSTARILAKALNCEHGPTPHPCGTCPSCLAISSGSSLDVIEIDGASNTSVDNIRQIKDEVLFAPHAGRYKIYIIDEVHMLSMSAFNALLKTIEEPPPYIVFIFATTEPQKVPATIKSRCQQFNFRLVPTETILQLLAQTAAEIGVEAEEEALLWIAREAAGSVRDAYTLFDQIASFSGSKISAQTIRDTLGLVGIDCLNDLFRAIVTNNTKEAFGVLDEILARGVSPEQFLTDAVDYCRSILLMLHGVQKEGLLSAPRTVFEPLVVESLSKAQIEYAIALLLDTYRHLKETIEPRYELELTVAKLCKIQSYISPYEVFEAIHSMQKALHAKEAPPPSLQDHHDDSADRSNTPNVPLLHDIHPRSTQARQRAEQSSQAEGSPQPEKAEAHSSSDDPISPSALKKKIITKLRNKNLFLASALEKSAEWLPKHNGFIIPAMNRVEMDLISRFAPLIAEIGSQILGTPCAIEAQYTPSVSNDHGNHRLGPQGALSYEKPEQHPEHSSDEEQMNTVQTAGQESNGALSDADGFEASPSDFSTTTFEESEDPAPSTHSQPAISSKPQELTETEVHVIEFIRKMFKGKVIETHTSPLMTPPEPLASQHSLSSNVADTAEYLEEMEAFEESEEDDLD